MQSGSRQSGKKERVIEGLTITQLAMGGEGVGKAPDGQVVFVSGTAPSDVVDVVVTKGSPLRGRVVRLVTASPLRAEPPCPYFGRCGGCDWMHLSGDARRQEHIAHVLNAVRHQTKLNDLPVPEYFASDKSLGYRNRARFRAESKRGGGLRIGYQAAHSHDLVEVDQCLVLHDDFQPVFGQVKRALEGAKGHAEISVARGKSGKPVVEMVFRGDVPRETFARLHELAADGVWDGALLGLVPASTKFKYGDPTIWMTGSDGLPFSVGESAFAQPSEEGAALIAQRVVHHLGRTKHESVCELFSGSGTLSVCIAKIAADFVGVEVNQDAVRCARDNFALRGLTGKFVAADAEKFPMKKVDAVVLDPPRAGARETMSSILRAKPTAVVYVSCSPPSLARDLAILVSEGAYKITSIDVVDLFPQTSHVESIVKLERNRLTAKGS